MRINWGMFLLSLAIIMAATFWTAGLVLACETNQGMWLLLWIPAALLTILAISAEC